MLTPFATSAEVAARWRPLSDAEDLLASILVQDASAIIRAKAKTVDTRISVVAPATLPALDPLIPTMVVCAMVRRAMIASGYPDVSSQQNTAGPFSQSVTFANPSGNLYLTKSEKDMLNVGGQKAFSVDPAPDAGVLYGAGECWTELTG